jgi:hypothetical protein
MYAVLQAKYFGRDLKISVLSDPVPIPANPRSLTSYDE